AAWRSARVDHALAVREVEAASCVRGAGILHGDRACVEARQALYRDGLGQQERRLAYVSRSDADRCEALRVGAGIGAAAVDAQAHRRMRIARLEHSFPAGGVVPTQSFDPPARVLVA